MSTLIDIERNKDDLNTIEHQIKTLEEEINEKELFLEQDELSLTNSRDMVARWKRHSEVLSELLSMMERCTFLQKEHLALLKKVHLALAKHDTLTNHHLHLALYSCSSSESDSLKSSGGRHPFNHAFGFNQDMTDDLGGNILSFVASEHIASRLCDFKLVSRKWKHVVRGKCRSEPWEMAHKHKFNS